MRKIMDYIQRFEKGEFAKVLTEWTTGKKI
jgi:hypothetical protein